MMKNNKRFEVSTKCKGCDKPVGYHEFIESIHRFANGSFHIRGECPYCRAYIKFIPYQESKSVKALLEIAHSKGNYEDIPKKVTIYDETTHEIY